MICTNCGKELPDGVLLCAQCGTQAEPVPMETAAEPVPEPAPETQMTAVAGEVPTAEATYAEQEAAEMQPQVPASEDVPVEPKRKKKLGWILGSIAAVLVLAGGALAVWHFVTENAHAESYKTAEVYLARGEYDRALAIFKDLDDYEDAAARAGELEKLQADYGAAAALMEAGQLDGAIEAFTVLGSYKDAPAQIQECYRAQALLALEDGDHDGALEIMDHMDKATRDSFREVFLSYCADGEALETLLTVLQDRMRMYDDGASEFDLIEMELEALSDFEDAYFYDEDLEDDIKDYLDVLEEYQDAMTYRQFFMGAAEWYEMLEHFHEAYGLFEGYEELQEEYLDMADYYWALVEIEEQCLPQFSGAHMQHDSQGYYLNYSNETDFEFYLCVYVYYYQGYEQVEYYETMLKVEPGSQIRIDIEIPARSVVWDGWLVYWDILDVTLDGERV